MFLTGGEMLFCGEGEYVSIMWCGCGLSAGAGRLLGGKGLGGGPDETEVLSFYLYVQNSVRHAVLIFTASLAHSDNVEIYYFNVKSRSKKRKGRQ